jgi:hypothetical protein
MHGNEHEDRNPTFAKAIAVLVSTDMLLVETEARPK